MDLTNEIVEQLNQLKLELEEEDITEKGYRKKRLALLEPYGGEEALQGFLARTEQEKPVITPRPNKNVMGQFSLDVIKQIQQSQQKGQTNEDEELELPVSDLKDVVSNYNEEKEQELNQLSKFPKRTNLKRSMSGPLENSSNDNNKYFLHRERSMRKPIRPTLRLPTVPVPTPSENQKLDEMRDNPGSPVNKNFAALKKSVSDLSFSSTEGSPPPIPRFPSFLAKDEFSFDIGGSRPEDQENIVPEMMRKNNMSYGMMKQAQLKSAARMEERGRRMTLVQKTAINRRSFLANNVRMNSFAMKKTHDIAKSKVKIPDGSICHFLTTNTGKVMTSFTPEGKEGETTTFSKQFERAQRFATVFLSVKYKVMKGEHVGLIIPDTEIEYFCSCFYGCLYVGIIPIVFSSESAERMGEILKAKNVKWVITCSGMKSFLGNYESWPKDIKYIWADKFSGVSKPIEASKFNALDIAYIRESIDDDGVVEMVEVCHSSLFSLCKIFQENEEERKRLEDERKKLGQKPKPFITVMCCPFSSELGFLYGIIRSMVTGHQLLYMPKIWVKTSPYAWLSLVSKKEATNAIIPNEALSVKLISPKEKKYLTLDSLESVIVNCNSLDHNLLKKFTNRLEENGLNPSVMCTVVLTSETLALTEPCKFSQPPNSLKLDFNALAQNVIIPIKSNDENTQQVELRSCGKLLQDVEIIICERNGNRICSTNEVGEILVKSNCTATGYYKKGIENNKKFKVSLSGYEGYFVRSGVIGFVHENHIYVCGKLEREIKIDNTFIYPEYIECVIRTLDRPLENDPGDWMISGSSFAAFPIRLLGKDQLVVVFESNVPEGDPNIDIWIESICALMKSSLVCLYTLVAVKPKTLRVGSGGQVWSHKVKKDFLKGRLEVISSYVDLSSCYENKAQVRQLGVDGVLEDNVKNLLYECETLKVESAPNNLENGNDIDVSIQYDMSNLTNISEVLKMRANMTPNSECFCAVEMPKSKLNTSKPLTFKKLDDRATKIAIYLQDKLSLLPGVKLGLMYDPGPEFLVAFYGCLYAGIIPVPLQALCYLYSADNSAAPINSLIEISIYEPLAGIMTTDTYFKLFMSREITSLAKKQHCEFYNGTKKIKNNSNSKNSLGFISTTYLKPVPGEIKENSAHLIDLPAFVEYNFLPEGASVGTTITHRMAISHCRMCKKEFELTVGSSILNSLQPYYGVGLLYGVLVPIYSGIKLYQRRGQHISMLLETVVKLKVRVAITNYSQFQSVLKNAKDSTSGADKLDFSSLDHIVMDVEGRPDIDPIVMLKDSGITISLASRIRNNFSAIINCSVTQNINREGPDVLKLRYIESTEGLCKIEHNEEETHYITACSSGLTSSSSQIVIANSITGKLCNENEIGEIWAECSSNVQEFTGLPENILVELGKYHLHQGLCDMPLKRKFINTGYSGFLRRHKENAENSQVFVLGATCDCFLVDNRRFFMTDIEKKVFSLSSTITESCVVIINNTVCVFVECKNSEKALAAAITTSLLGEGVPVDSVTFVPQNTISLNRRFEKDRLAVQQLYSQSNCFYIKNN